MEPSVKKAMTNQVKAAKKAVSSYMSEFDSYIESLLREVECLETQLLHAKRQQEQLEKALGQAAYRNQRLHEELVTEKHYADLRASRVGASGIHRPLRTASQSKVFESRHSLSTYASAYPFKLGA